jgi:hypothetical protein
MRNAHSIQFAPAFLRLWGLLHQESVRGATFRLTAHLDEVMQT